jgi:penicillin-binding protein 1A
MPFLEGTQPTRYCDLHDGAAARAGQVNLQGMRFDTMFMDSDNLLGALKLPELQMDTFLPGRPEPAARPNTRTAPAAGANADAQTPPRNTRTVLPDEEFGLELPDYNPLLD